MPYKTVKQVKEELNAIDPGLLSEYEIRQHKGGVMLIRGETTITSQKTDLGTGTLYKVHPKVDNVGFKKAYNTLDDVAGGLSLEKAVIIAELTYTRALYGKSLDKVLGLYAKDYFGDGGKQK